MGFGSFIKKAAGAVGGAAKKVGGAVGDVAKYAAPAAVLIPGVGPVAAGLIGAAGGALGKLNDENASFGGALKDAALHGVTGYAGAKGVEALRGKMLGAPGAAAASGDAAADGPSIMDRIQSLTGLGKPGGLSAKDLIAGGIGLYGAKQAHDAGNKADELMNERLNMARQQYAETAPIRQAANAGVLSSLDRLGGKMLAPPDLSYLQDNANPFRKKFAAPVGA